MNALWHCLGLDHKQLTDLHNGREERPTSNSSKIVKAVPKRSCGCAGSNHTATVNGTPHAGTAGDRKFVNLRYRRLEIHVQDEAVNSTALATVMMALSDSKVSLVSVRSVGQQTEQAYLDLVEKEESRGFARIYRPQDEAA